MREAKPRVLAAMRERLPLISRRTPYRPVNKEIPGAGASPEDGERDDQHFKHEQQIAHPKRAPFNDDCKPMGLPIIPLAIESSRSDGPLSKIGR